MVLFPMASMTRPEEAEDNGKRWTVTQGGGTFRYATHALPWAMG